jgi:hypothetical protein
MSDVIKSHLIKYPHARTSTVQYLARRHETTERLRQEIEAAKQVNRFRDSIGYVGWFRLLKKWMGK